MILFVLNAADADTGEDIDLELKVVEEDAPKFLEILIRSNIPFHMPEQGGTNGSKTNSTEK
ncbi:hypothetical protein CUC43_25955 [Bacillus thuringiensis LM1212]|uniref:hypothetical protein n=1 Tax=Bacillus cereus group TaxID=86661 RepID=UPI00041FC745|nr:MULTISPECIES: hypothetical protein [Bacillus cereus group]AXY09980.1 hypothetical protein CUC43_25955 [Bacillus thuringiensis LM1212]QDF22881.1 hypothetical protein FJR70_07525 [Bacillus tropicus]QUG96203.1 hypothetical protein HCM98_15210 [Bacillus tropicus]